MQAFVREDTKIPEQALHGVISLAAHSENINNPFLHANKGLLARIEKGFRKVVIQEIDDELTKEVSENKAHEALPEAEHDRVVKDQERFAWLAEGFKTVPAKREHGQMDDGTTGKEPHTPMTRRRTRTPYMSSAERERSVRYPAAQLEDEE